MGTRTTRRTFMAGAAAAGLSAAGYARAAGANERLRIGQIGCGGRGIYAHMKGVRPHAKDQNVVFAAVADPWGAHCREAAAKSKEWFGEEAKQCSSYRDLLDVKDLDAVMIASCDHQHTTHLKAAAEAKMDVYCEKPLAMEMPKLAAACDACRDNKIVVQIGTQLRSRPTFTGCRKLYRTGILGKVGRIEQCRNGSRPYWYSRIRDVKEKDVNWEEFLLDRPKRPFDPLKFAAWYGFREFSDGPVPGLGSHFIDLVHYITGATYPANCVCLGGTFTWKDKYQFTCPDHVQALWTYPEGFMVTYSTNFGNSWGNSFKILGDVGSMDLVNWSAPIITARGGSKKKGAIRGDNPVKEVPRPDHYLNWLQCIRSREDPIAPIEAGYQHAVAVIMAMTAYDTGRRQAYDHAKREIRPG